MGSTTNKKGKAFGNEGIASKYYDLASSAPRVQRTYRALIHYIYQEKFQTDDLLPHHEDLRKHLRTGSNTLNEAINMLVRDGALERIRGKGTRLKHLDIVSLQTWTIGFPVFRELEHGFRPMLEHYIRCALIQHGCSDRSYLSLPDTETHNELLKTKYFPGLSEDLKAKRLDGIISLHGIEKQPIPICSVAATTHSEFGVSIDDENFVLEATQTLKARNFTRIAIFGSRLYNEKRKAFLKKHAPKMANIIWINQESVGGILAGKECASKLKLLPKTKKIDGIIALDDVMLITLIGEMQWRGAAVPAIAVQSNKQLPMPIPGRNVFRFEIDIKQLADLATEALVKKLLEPNCQPGVQKIIPQYTPE